MTGWAVWFVVASEGLKDESGKPVVPPIFQTGRSVYYGDVGAYLAELVIKNLGIKARSEKPGLCGRASISLQSPVDREEAVLAGREALKAAMEGCTGIMIGFARREQEKYEVCPHPYSGGTGDAYRTDCSGFLYQ